MPVASPDVVASRGHRGTRAIQRLVEFAPSTGGLALWVPHADVDGETLVENDGRGIAYGPGFERLALDVQTGLVAHQVLHVALRHAQRHLDLRRRTGDVDLRLFNICADAIVNSALGHLGWLKLPAGSVRLEQLLERVLGQHVSADEALLAWDVEGLYRAIDDRRPSGGRDGDASNATRARRVDGPNASASRALGAAIVADLAPLPDADAPEDDAEHMRTWHERLVRAHANDGDFSLLRTLVADLAPGRTPWEQVLRTRLARALSTRPSLSWSRPTRSYLANRGRAGPGRRMPWEPGDGGTRVVPRLAVVVDVSGSIDDALMARFATEIDAITRRLGAALVLVVGDDRVRCVTTCAPGRSGLCDVAFDGGGATDFTPLLEAADRHRPDLAVVLTDLDGPARYEPRCPVIWAVPEASRAAVAPFGRTLVLS